MKGIHCAALQGRVGRDVELCRSESGKDWCRLSSGVGEGDELTWVSVSGFEEKARALAGLAKGVEVYNSPPACPTTARSTDDAAS